MTRAAAAGRNEMRDLFRSGSAAQFLLHGNVFDVVPAGGRLLSLPAFLDEVMFASYDVVLRYDRSRGVRATRGADDWGDWLQQALGRDDKALTLMREPGSALELIDRYLLRTLNLQAVRAASGDGAARVRRAHAATHRRHHRVRRVRRAARRRAAARRRRLPPTSSRCSAGPTTPPSRSRTSSRCWSAKGCTI